MAIEEIVLSDSDDDLTAPSAPRPPASPRPRPSHQPPLPSQSTSSQPSTSQQARAPIKVGAWAGGSPSQVRSGAVARSGGGGNGLSPARATDAGPSQAGQAWNAKPGSDKKGKEKQPHIIDLLSSDGEKNGPPDQQESEDDSAEDLPVLDAVINKPKRSQLSSSSKPLSSGTQISSKHRQRDRSSSDELSILPTHGRRASMGNLSRPPPRKPPRPSLPTASSSQTFQPKPSTSKYLDEALDRQPATPRASTSQAAAGTPKADKPKVSSTAPSVSKNSPSAPSRPSQPTSAPSSHSSQPQPPTRKDYLEDADASDSDSSIEFLESNQRPSLPKRPPVETKAIAAGLPVPARGSDVLRRASGGAILQPDEKDEAPFGSAGSRASKPDVEAQRSQVQPMNFPPSALRAASRKSEGPPQVVGPVGPGKVDGVAGGTQVEDEELGFAEDEDEEDEAKTIDVVHGFAGSASPAVSRQEGQAAPSGKGAADADGDAFAGFASSGDESDEVVADSDDEAVRAVPRSSGARARRVLSDSEEEQSAATQPPRARPIARKSLQGPAQFFHADAAVAANPSATQLLPPISTLAPRIEKATAATSASPGPSMPDRPPSAPSSAASFRARKSTGGMAQRQVERPTLPSAKPPSNDSNAADLPASGKKRRAASPSSAHMDTGRAQKNKRRKGPRKSQEQVAAATLIETTTVSVGQAQAEEELTPEELRKRDEVFKAQQRRLPASCRQFAGPSYDWRQEFDTSTHDWIREREREWLKGNKPEPWRDGYHKIFSDMIEQAILAEYGYDHPFRPTIRVIPPKDAPPTAWSSPPFEFIYTNRVVYEDGIVPRQAPGCECEGDCSTSANCNCLARQIEASRSKPNGDKRSDMREFAYTKEGRLKPEIFDHGDLIIECNSMCGCGPECQNRVVGERNSISVEIFWTGMKGWAVRLPESWAEEAIHSKSNKTGKFETSVLRRYKAKPVKKGQPLAIYSGELMPTQRAYDRENLVYNHIARSYLYDLDAWPIAEEVKAKGSASYLHKLDSATAAVPSRTSKSHTNHYGHGGGDDQEYENPYAIDAFCVGNWTRYANHVCQDFNATARAVYIDDDDVTRPLWCYFALRDIAPGEEIAISYFSADDSTLDFMASGMTPAQWKAGADREREEAPPDHRCYCKKPFCRGRMFRPLAEESSGMFYEKRS